MRSIVLLSLFTVATASQASSLKITGLSLGGNTGTLALSNVTGLSDGTYYAGPFDASLDGGAAMRVFCGDLVHHTQFNAGTSVSPTDTAGLGLGFQTAARLLNKYGATAGNDPLKNAALQAAVWKSIFPTLAYADGTAGASALAGTYLASTDLAGYSAHATFYDFGGANQSMIGVPKAVPEPASMAALAVGAMGLLRRRAKR